MGRKQREKRAKRLNIITKDQRAKKLARDAALKDSRLPRPSPMPEVSAPDVSSRKKK